MGYNKDKWRRRIAERTDLSTHLVHLTRERKTSVRNSPTEVLLDIIDEQRIIASTSHSGFICGDTPAVCFQDAPLVGICQNVFYEQKYKEQNQPAKLRYRAIGIAIQKDYAYSKGARPVIYDKAATAKKYLDQNEWWRIVNFDLSDENNTRLQVGSATVSDVFV